MRKYKHYEEATKILNNMLEKLDKATSLRVVPVRDGKDIDVGLILDGVEMEEIKKATRKHYRNLILEHRKKL